MEVWEQQPNETRKAYEAFALYRDMAERTYEKVRLALGRKAGYMRQLEYWASDFHWVERATAYDRHLDSVRQAAAIKAVADEERRKWQRRQQQIREREYVQAEELFKRAELMLKFPLQRTESEDGKTIIYPAKWTGATVSRYLETASKLSRLAAGMATEHLKLAVTPEQIEEMSDVELAQFIRELEAQAKDSES